MIKRYLVTGANGHLGNNLIRILLHQGKSVKAGVRNLSNEKPFKDLNCELVYMDIMDRNSLSKAMENVDIIFQVAAVFKNYAKNPEDEIIKPAIEGTKNVLELASQKGISKIIYVSSIAALELFQKNATLVDETSWNTSMKFPYDVAKTESERIALKLADKFGIHLVSVLPGGMIGPNLFGHLTPTMNFLNQILLNNLFIDINYFFSFIDIRDVVHGMISAEENGKNLERYILSSGEVISLRELIRIAQLLYPEVKSPIFKPSKSMLKLIAFMIEGGCKLIGKAPPITYSGIEHLYGAKPGVDISKAKNELGFKPRPVEESIKDAFQFLHNNYSHFK